MCSERIRAACPPPPGSPQRLPAGPIRQPSALLFRSCFMIERCDINGSIEHYSDDYTAGTMEKYVSLHGISLQTEKNI